jgi:hypothetical protein
MKIQLLGSFLKQREYAIFNARVKIISRDYHYHCARLVQIN